MNRFQRTGAVGCGVAITTPLGFGRVLRRCGFRRSPRSNPAMISEWGGRFSPVPVARREDWDLVRGDADGDFWTTD